MLKEPPLPPVANPLPIANKPLFPEDDVPELKISFPLTPCVPAFTLYTTTVPLDVDDPCPLPITIKPPVALAPIPPIIEIKPPWDPAPCPPTMLIIPPVLAAVEAESPA